MEQRQVRLTLGDAVAIAALLFFILAWLAGWSFLLWWFEEEGNDVGDLGSVGSALLIALAGVPSLWAAGLISEIAEGDKK